MDPDFQGASFEESESKVAPLSGAGVELQLESGAGVELQLETTSLLVEHLRWGSLMACLRVPLLGQESQEAALHMTLKNNVEC